MLFIFYLILNEFKLFFFGIFFRVSIAASTACDTVLMAGLNPFDSTILALPDSESSSFIDWLSFEFISHENVNSFSWILMSKECSSPKRSVEEKCSLVIGCSIFVN